MEKVKDFIKKMFNCKNKKKSIIAIVALIQCIILVGLMTYSWIESLSSLVIKGEDLPINSNLNYRFDVKDGATNNVDLSTYFRPTALYQLAKASTSDANNFYFKKENGNSYRLGDTTDYNTSYYNFDFQVHNETAKSYAYYFNTANIFDVTSTDESVTEAMLTVAEKAMRISVTAGTNSSNTRIYSIDSKTYNAVNTKAGGTKSITSTGLTNSNYVYNRNNNPEIFVFSTTGGGDDTKVTVKIWFEEKDAQYQALTAEQKNALLGCTVKIDFQFVNAASNYQTFFFDDYTFSIEENHEGQPVTTEDKSKSLYFLYKEGQETQIIPMTTTTSDNGVVRWVTASEDGNAAPRISDDMRNKLVNGSSSGYFFYGTYNASTGSRLETYKWNVSSPAVNDGDVYIFKALSVMQYKGDDTSGYGVWDNVDIELYKFKDMATSATSDPHNPNAFRFINDAGQGHLYLSKSTVVSAQATRMYYDATEDVWKGYFDKLSENADDENAFLTPVFSYTTKANYTNENDTDKKPILKVQWSAENPMANSSGEKVFTALGYEGTGAAGYLETTASGVGTWANVEEIKFSTELVDASMSKEYRYKIGVDFGGSSTDVYKYYYMALADSATCWKAYVPMNSGNTGEDYIAFQRYKNPSSDTVEGAWNTTTKVARNGSSIYYATNMAATSSEGQWHIAVVVDGSVDNIVQDVLMNVENAKLEYSVDDGKTYIEMNNLDDYRWYTNDFDSSVKIINYKWTAYVGEGVNEAVFSYGHDLANGIYFNITE